MREKVNRRRHVFPQSSSHTLLYIHTCAGSIHKEPLVVNDLPDTRAVAVLAYSRPVARAAAVPRASRPHIALPGAIVALQQARAPRARQRAGRLHVGAALRLLRRADFKGEVRLHGLLLYERPAPAVAYERNDAEVVRAGGDADDSVGDEFPAVFYAGGVPVAHEIHPVPRRGLRLPVGAGCGKAVGIAKDGPAVGLVDEIVVDAQVYRASLSSIHGECRVDFHSPFTVQRDAVLYPHVVDGRRLGAQHRQGHQCRNKQG